MASGSIAKVLVVIYTWRYVLRKGQRILAKPFMADRVVASNYRQLTCFEVYTTPYRWYSYTIRALQHRSLYSYDRHGIVHLVVNTFIALKVNFGGRRIELLK